MVFSPINIEEELLRLSSRVNKKEFFIREVNNLLEAEARNEQMISENLRLTKPTTNPIPVNYKNLSRSKIVSIADIKNICTKYRLRFLKSGYYKNEFPYEALIKIKEVERNAGCELNDFYLVAPADAFKLQDRNKDPLLFAHLGNNNYYLIHKWGNDLAWYRRLWSFPLRNLEALFIVILVVSCLVAWLFPSSFMLGRNVPAEDLVIYRFFVLMWCVLVQSAALAYIFFAFHKNFSSAVWRSHYFN